MSHQRPIHRRHCRRLVAAASLLSVAALALVLLWPSPADAAAFRHERDDPREQVLRSPLQPSNSSVNWIWRAYNVPSGSTFASFEYDYLCSGRSGIICASEYSTSSSSGPWTTMQSQSAGPLGVHQSGHIKVSLPTASPTIWVRFRYVKQSITAFQDGFWVDDVRFRTNTSEHHETFAPETPLGSEWVPGGTDGGFRQMRLPPARALGPSEDMGPSTTIGIERAISGFTASGNRCAITYATDTAPTHKLQVWESSILRMEKSGRAAGTEMIELTSSPGTKTLRLEFLRDANPTQGTNLVRVRAITCYTGDSITVGHYDFDGQAIDSAPYQGWTQSCAGSGCGSWLVVRPTPHQSYVPVQAFGTEPFNLDGLPREYKKQGNPTAVPQFDWAHSDADRAVWWLFATSSSLHIYGRLHADSPGVMGTESGTIYCPVTQII